ncbi:MAG TPA: LutB/LldF family L-lactate oxidation iron-sulfur protein [Methylovirgula sp.]|nr:LutB/LldF family L-lactate oxidation iron-sulfur protein [Methylovirgula sp.]
MSPASQFVLNAHRAMHDAQLQKALYSSRAGFIAKRAKAAARLPEFEALRDAARDIKAHTLAHLDLYLEAYESKVQECGGEVHYARTPEAANAIILDICRRHKAVRVVKGKTMVGEEIGLNAALKARGIEPIETDLGEYAIQLRGEMPSHIIAPAVHLTKEQIAADFRRVHVGLPEARDLSEAAALLAEARAVLREKFLSADVGITGANFLIAETGSSIIVTNEGNGDLAETLPKVHIVLASIEKLVPTLEDAAQLMRVLARSGTGQDLSVYTTFATGPRRPGDPDGPQDYHVVLLDNGRSAMLGSEFAEVLRCIRCGACMNHCPVYQSVGGHAYGAIYSGPIGAVMTPAFIGIENAVDLPHASSLCGACESVCPVRIPLPKLLRRWREKSFERSFVPAHQRLALSFWGAFARRPLLYRVAAGAATRMLSLIAGEKGRFKALPFARSWMKTRDFPAPEGETFQAQFARRTKAHGK